MKTFYLHENWEMKRSGGDALSTEKGITAGFAPAFVPGSVYSDLLRNGKMPDPFWRDNEAAVFALMEDDWEYRCFFTPDASLFDYDKIILRFEGLDTLASIFLNEKKIGFTNNQHRIWKFDITSILKKNSQNSLQIIFHSPNKFCRENFKKYKVSISSDSLDGFPYIRKAHCAFGWDWGPRLPDAGIWRPVSLLGIEAAYLDSVYITQNHSKNKVTLNFEVRLNFDAEIRRAQKAETYYEVEITYPNGQKHILKNSPRRAFIDKPELWWCNGFGKQSLYTICVNLFENGRLVDKWERRIGLRVFNVRREKDKWGTSFAFELNGVQIFSMGANYIPEDSIFARMSKERTRKLLEQCVMANFNTIRVWGGGFYPEDYFFDICDELGLLVWQDFMFACAIYEVTEEFEENVCLEIIDTVERLRHHPSLALWCGNNEIEAAFVSWGWKYTPAQKTGYLKLFEFIIPRLTRVLDPERFYWCSSPSCGGSFDNPSDETRGDVHYWDVWHGNKPFSEYRQFYFRYLSEFGFQSFPSLKTIETFTEKEDRNIFSYIMEKHQRNGQANGKILNYLSQYFLYPENFETLLYASQLLQAEAVKYGVEHLRRNRGRCMGALYWQLNDIWPVASWSSIDYFHRWKALHYYARRFFAPLTIFCNEEGFFIFGQNINAQNLNYENCEKSFCLCVTNETMIERSVEARWEIRDNTAKVLEKGRQALNIAPLSSKYLQKIKRRDIDIFSQYVSFSLYEKNKLVENSDSTVIFSVPKFFHYLDPELFISVDGDKITVRAKNYAKCVAIQNAADDLILSDNYFDMNAGEKTVTIIRGAPNGIRAKSVWNIK